MPQSFFEWVAFIFKQYFPLFMRGTLNTIIISVSGTVIGFVIGLFVAVARTVNVDKKTPFLKRATVKIAQWILTAYIQIFRGTPMIVQSMVIYYGAMQYLQLAMPPLFAAVLIVSINTGAYMAEIIRGGIISVDKGQIEGAQSLGMTHWQTMAHVVLPQAIRNIMPSLGNEFVVNIKDSSVLNVISVNELFFASKSAAGTYYRYFEAFFITAVIYFILTFVITKLLRIIEKKMDGSATYEINNMQPKIPSNPKTGGA